MVSTRGCKKERNKEGKSFICFQPAHHCTREEMDSEMKQVSCDSSYIHKLQVSHLQLPNRPISVQGHFWCSVNLF